MKVVTVCRENLDPVCLDLFVFIHDRKIENHLIHFSITVPPDSSDDILQRIEYPDGFFCIVICRKRIPGAVIEQISQQKKPVGSFPVICI